MVRTICLFAVCLLAAVPAPGRDVHVNNQAGDDRFEGSEGRWSAGFGPVRTIAKALRLAEPGDRVVLANTGQPYREAVSLIGSQHSGSEVRPFVIEGNGATLDGTGDVPDDRWAFHQDDVFCFSPRRLHFQQLYVGGRPLVRRPTTPADVTLPELEPLEWCLAGGKIYFRVETGKLPQDYHARCAALQTGISLYYVRDVIVSNLTIQGFQQDGINAFDVVGSARLAGLKCRGNGRSGISVSGVSRIDVDDCLLGANGESQLRSEGFAETHVYRTKFNDAVAPALDQRGGNVVFEE